MISDFLGSPPTTVFGSRETGRNEAQKIPSSQESGKLNIFHGFLLFDRNMFFEMKSAGGRTQNLTVRTRFTCSQGKWYFVSVFITF